MNIKEKIEQQFRSSSDSQTPFYRQLFMKLPFLNVWRWFVDFIYRQPEPEVWERRDRQGNIYWFAYDPATGQSAYLASEQEVMMWIEQIYYQKNLGSHQHRW